MVESFPLSWPQGYPRAKHRKRSSFKTSFVNARDGLLDELRLMRAGNIVISTNQETYWRGGREIPYAKQQRTGEDPGVAVYFTWNGESYVLACDQWTRIEENMQAIRKAVEALRGLDRWGVSEMLKRAFTGFKALPENGVVTTANWWDILGVSQNASLTEVKHAYREMCKIHHPDVGGNESDFVRITEAYEQAISLI